MLFRWFIGLAMEDAVWDHSVFSRNRERLLEHQVIEPFFTEVMTTAVQILVEACQQGGKNMHIFYDKVFLSASSA